MSFDCLIDRLSSAIHRVLALLVLAGLGVVCAGCASERVGAPEPEKSALVVLGWRLSPTRSWIGLLDTEADTVLGEVPDVGSQLSVEVQVSPDGKYLATVDRAEGLHVFDAQTLALVGQAPVQAITWLSFTPDASQIFAIGTYGPNTVYDLPALSIDTVLSERYALCLPSPRQEELIAITTTGKVLGPDHGVARLSTGSWAVVDSFKLISPATNGPIMVRQLELTPDGNRLIILASDAVAYALYLFDLESHACLFRTPLVSNSGFALSPDAREIWVVQGHGSPVPPDFGYVLIVDAATGVPLDTIPTLGPRSDRPNEPFTLGSLVFHPTEPRAFLSTGEVDPSILVINIESREVESTLHLGPIHDLAIAPR